MKILLSVLVMLFSLIFLLVGLCWIIDPSMAASFLGMPLMVGLGLSSQIGDIGAFFLGAGTIIALGMKTQNAVWYYAAAFLVGFAASLRLVAWAVHGAPFALEQITIEIVIVAVLLGSARCIRERA